MRKNTYVGNTSCATQRCPGKRFVFLLNVFVKKCKSSVSYPLATYIGVEKIRYKHPSRLQKSIDITFIENGPVVFESILTSDEPTTILTV